MNRRLIGDRFAMVLLLLGGLPIGLVAQTEGSQNADNTGYGTAAGEFLLLGAGARGTALGGAFSAVATDVSSMYYNPGGLAEISGPGATVGTFDYVADTRYTWAGLAFPFSGGQRAIGLQLGTFGFKDQPVYTVEAPDGTGGTYSVNETFVGLTLSQNFSDRFSAGLTAKGIFDQLGQASGQAFGLDFGASFHAKLSDRPIRLAFTVANLGTDLTYHGDALNTDIPRPIDPTIPSLPQPGQLRTKGFPLPTTFRVGLAYEVLGGEASHLTVLSDFSQGNQNRAGFTAGGEYAMNKLGGSPFGFALRGSYSYAPANNVSLTDPTSQTALTDEENLQGLAAGGGLSYTTTGFNLGLDYAYKYMGILGPTNFFSVTVGW
jgi:hypothetical protein